MKLGKLQLKKAVQSFQEDSLFRNAVFLMSSTAIMSVLGFGFWFFVAHLYAPSEIGIASALVSISLLTSNLSFFGLNAGLLRFLPNSKNPSGDINASLITVGTASMFAAAAYLFLIGGHLTGRLGIFSGSFLGELVFVLLMATVSLNTFTDSVFIANRRAELHTIVYAVFGLVKLILPLFLITLGSLGIFTAYVAAAFASLVLSLIFMRRYCGYRILSHPDFGFIARSRKYASNNYVAVLVGGLPSQIMPSLIIERLGEAHAAFFSMAWTMANLLYVIPSAITNSLLAESSHDISKQSRNVKHAVRILTITLVPAVLIAIVVAPYLLKLFGAQYSSGGTLIFQLLALSTFSLAANSIGNTIMNIEHRSGGIVLVQGTIAVFMIGLGWPLMKFGLAGVGVAMLLGNVAGNIVQLMLLKKGRRNIAQSEPASSLTTPSSQVVRSFLATYNLGAAKIGKDIGGGDRSGTVVVTAGHEKYVLKMYSIQKRQRAQLEQELEFTRMLLENGVPAPRVLANSADEKISQVSVDGAEWLGVLMRYEPGIHPETYSEALLGNMAHIQGRIHRIGAEFAGNITNSKSLKSSSHSMGSSLVRYAPKGVSHFDYYRGNLLATDDIISCVIDFEGMRYDPLVVCIFFTLTTLYQDPSDAKKLQVYLKSYQDVRPLNWMEKRVIQIALALRFRAPKLLLIQF
ncbi:MAG TPA: phosphotransferase [Candidatus Saccharimonadia bacterium]|nr:phosphotransferase [Candidatus Saccharimonadia bacterium]